MRIINVVAGGPKELIPDLSAFHSEDVRWIGVDRGALTLIQSGIIPDKVFGDFDSVTNEERSLIQEVAPSLHLFQTEKDQTDLELALDWSLEKKPHLIHVFGISGGRADHFLGNIQLLYKGIQQQTTIKFIDKQNEISMFSPGTYEIDVDDTKPYISFIPFTEKVNSITLIGFKYPLNNCHISLGSTLCISNELIHSRGAFSFAKGILIMIRSTD